MDRPYLDLAVLERALTRTGSDAAWVGWGFVAEDPSFAEMCARIDVTFIGPSASAMRRLGDKIGSKLLAEEVGVPVAPWSRGAVDDIEAALAAASKIGYPLMLKATAGGGGRGIRVVTSDHELTDAFERTRDEAARAFGNGVVFLERLVTGARHVEVQVIADGQGTAWALGVRDCSVQRRNQKVIEESASPLLDHEQVGELKASAERLALAVDYCGAATVEFLYHPGERSFAFLEVNTRLQVEHPITELTTGFDLVKAQLHVASGGRLEGERPTEFGHAVEARLNAEDPDRDFAPSPGRIALLNLPSGPGIRVDTGVAQGDLIPADFDSMIAKIIAHGRTRAEACARLSRALADTVVLIEGGTTNKSFLLDLLDQPEIIDGSADTGWIDRVRSVGRLQPDRYAGVALVAAAIEAYKEQVQAERLHFLATAHGGRPQARHEVGRAIELKLRGTSHRVTVAQVGPTRFRVGFGAAQQDRQIDADLEQLDEYAARLVIGDVRYRLISATHGPVHLIEVNSTTHRVTRDEGGVLRSPAPALVVATPVAVGDRVEAGAPVLVLESMKMETVLHAPYAAQVRELFVSTGGQVETGTPVVRLEPVAEDEVSTPGAPVVTTPRTSLDLPTPTPTKETAATRAARSLDDVRGPAAGIRPRTRGRYQRASPATSVHATSCRRPVSWCWTTRSTSSAHSPTWQSWPATGRLKRMGPTNGSTARVSTFTATCTAWTSTANTCPTASVGAWPEPSRTTGSAISNADQCSRRLYSGSSLPSARRPIWSSSPSCSIGWPGSRPWAAQVTRLERSWTGSCWPPSCDTRWWATWRAASGSAGSTSRWSTPNAAPCWLA